MKKINGGIVMVIIIFIEECMKAIKENKIFYECTVCEEINICRDCYKSTGHPHKMKKMKVPVGCKVIIN